ncbi:MAG: hypothetical protein ACJAV4_000023 [Pontimonas sp.]|jgi:hypothetical protein
MDRITNQNKTPIIAVGVTEYRALSQKFSITVVLLANQGGEPIDDKAHENDDKGHPGRRPR